MLPAVSTWAVTAGAVTAPQSAGWLVGAAVAGGAVALLAGLFLRRRPPPVPTVGRPGRGTRPNRSSSGIVGVLITLAAVLLLAGAGAAVARAAHEATRAGPIGAAILERAAVTADLVVADEPRPLGPPAALDPGVRKPDAAARPAPENTATRVLVRGTIVSATAAGRRFGASTPVLVIGDGRWSAVRTGQTVLVSGALTPAEPGSREAALLSANAPPRLVADASALHGGAGVLRDRLREASAVQSVDAGQLVPGLVLGDRGPLGEELRTAMMTSSLTHLTAVSGTNATIVTGCVFVLCTLCRVPRAATLVLSLGALAGFVLVVGPDPSVLRAAVMGGIGAVAVLSGRGRVALSLLCAAVVILVLTDPYLSTSLGFTLSVVATAALVVLSGPVADALTGLCPARLTGAPLVERVIRLVSTPVVAQAACAPLLVLVQPSVSTWAVPANAAAAPAVPVVTIAGTVAVVVIAVWPPAAVPAVWVAARCADLIAGIARLFASAPAASVPWPTGPWGLMLLAALDGTLLALVLLWARRRTRSRVAPDGDARRTARGSPTHAPDQRALPWRARGGPRQRSSRQRSKRRRPGRRASGRWRPGRRLGGAVVALAAAGLLVDALLTGVTRGLPSAPVWQLAMCDVGQGDGLALRVDGDTAILVDVGPPGDAMDRCLDRLGVHHLAAVLLTHQHDDHYGGLPAAMRGRRVDRLWVSAADTVLAPAVSAVVRSTRVPVERLQAPAAGAIGPVRWQVIWPRTTRPAGEENDNSVVLRVETTAPDGSVLRVLLTGDLEDDAATVLIRDRSTATALHDVDVVKVAHHGARNGGTAILDATRPAMALVSVGRDNDYGHPNPGVLDRLRALGVTVWRSDQQGGATVRRAGDRLRVEGLGS